MGQQDNSVYEGVAEALVEVLGLEPEEVRPDASIAGDLGAESLDVVDLLFHLKRRFGVQANVADIRTELVQAAAQTDVDESDEEAMEPLWQQVTVTHVVEWVKQHQSAPEGSRQ